MKTIFIFLLAFVFSGCVGKIHNTCCFNVEKKEELAQSYKKWKALDIKNYSYETSFSSYVGFGNKSVIHVEDSKVVKKEYEEWNNNFKITDSFIESKNNLGKNKKGSDLKTIDELYEQCYKILREFDVAQDDISLSFDNKGILKTCLTRNKMCADDCSSGIIIDKIKF